MMGLHWVSAVNDPAESRRGKGRLPGICFCPRRDGNGQDTDRRRGVRRLNSFFELRGLNLHQFGINGAIALVDGVVPAGRGLLAVISSLATVQGMLAHFRSFHLAVDVVK